MEIRRVLYPTDFSSRAEAALPYLTSISRKYDAEIHVLYVVDDIAYHKPWYGEFEAVRVEKILEYEKKTAEERLEQICVNHLKGCPLYIRHVAVGDPAQKILQLIHDQEIDLVIMAASGEKGFYPFGSVTEKVMRHSPAPVTIVPAN